MCVCLLVEWPSIQIVALLPWQLSLVFESDMSHAALAFTQ